MSVSPVLCSASGHGSDWETSPMNATCLVSLLMLATSCAAEPQRYTFTAVHMGTQFKIIVYAKNEATASKGVKAAFARIAELDGIMSDYKQASELMQLCK